MKMKFVQNGLSENCYQSGEIKFRTFFHGNIICLNLLCGGVAVNGQRIPSYTHMFNSLEVEQIL